MRDGGKIRTPSINSNPEYQLISRVAPSQLKKPRVRSVDTRGWSWYEGFVLPPSRIRGPGIDITTFPQSKFLLIFAFMFFVNSHHDITKIGAFKWVVKLVKWDTKMGREIYIARFLIHNHKLALWRNGSTLDPRSWNWGSTPIEGAFLKKIRKHFHFISGSDFPIRHSLTVTDWKIRPRNEMEMLSNFF